MGVSGGEEGALNGPSLMPGGDRSAYEELEPMLRKIAAKANQQEAVAVQTSASSKRQVGPNSRHDPSHVDLGSILFLPKTKTTPIARLNPYAHVGTDGSITPNPNIQNIVNALREYYHCGDTTLLDPETAEMMSVGELE